MKQTTNEKLSIYNGIASTISTNTVNGFIPLFAIGVLGATNQQMGLITSLPSIIGMLALVPGAMWLNRVGSKRNFAALSTFATRFLFMLIFFIPFLPIENPVWLLVILIALVNFPGALSGLSWQSMIGDMIPEKRRGDFFSSRNRITTIVAMIMTFLTGFFIQQFDRENAFPYQILLAFGFIFAIIEVYFLFKHKEKRREKPAVVESNIKKPTLKVYKHKPYLYFICCALFFNFAAQMGWSIFSIYHVREAEATALWFSLFSVTNQIAQIISIKWWARHADKYGNTMMLVIVSAGMATAPILTVLSTNLVYITAINFWIGLFVSGMNLLLFNQLLNASPEKDRTNYIANYNFLLSFIGFFAPQFGVFLLNQFGMFSAMSITSVVRFMAGILFLVVAITFEKRSLKLLPKSI
ncbi:MFS transporter [Pseudalkalibacillus caeni]|uniref:MFS transporter n=1 Tax=Exobacillus caeni TaxID=2574798 RepID=A0A5R9F235_9BACL|nr:MFS transporter [Pseudalkalibacillus caeni]TLS37131.1 MFS transporter [Pseudalkalibacillus caeni]